MIDPLTVVECHRFLYYVLKCPCWTDAQYDAYLKSNKIGALPAPGLTPWDYSPVVLQRAIHTLNWHIMKNYVPLNAQKQIDWDVFHEAKDIIASVFDLKQDAKS